MIAYKEKNSTGRDSEISKGIKTGKPVYGFKWTTNY
jgi:hypothetical protein